MTGEERHVITTLEVPSCTTQPSHYAIDALLLPFIIPLILLQRLFESINTLSSTTQTRGTTLVNITYDSEGRIASIIERKM